MFSTKEILSIAAISIISLIIIIFNFLSKDKAKFLSPITLFAALYLFYFAVGPTIRVIYGYTYVDTIDFRHYMEGGWICALASLLSLCAGYYFTNFKILVSNFCPIERLYYQHRIFWCIAAGVTCYFGLTYIGTQIGINPFNKSNPFSSPDTLSGGAFWGYFYFTINVCTVFVLLLLVSFPNNNNVKFFAAFTVILAVCIYLNVGFRGRIVYMITALFIAYHLVNSKRVGFIFLLTSSALVVFLSTVVVLTRQYLSGIQISLLFQYSAHDFFINSVQDSVIFLTMSAVVDYFPHSFDYIGFDPIYYASILPVPRMFWPDKPYPEYLLLIGRIHGYDGTQTGGQAVPNIGEYYMMFGWYGVIIISFIIGVFYKTLWNWISFYRNSKIACIFYALVCAMIFPLISRGYLAQFCMEFIFNTGIMLVIIFIYREKLPKYYLSKK